MKVRLKVHPIFRRVALLSIALLALSGASVRADDIIQVAEKQPELSNLLEAIRAADLTAELKKPGPFTVLAPTNDATAKLPQSAIDFLQRPENRDKLRALLLYHVIAGKYTSQDTAGASPGTSAPTLNGESIQITSLDPPTINKSHIIKLDILADNGVIHLIDAVLIPPSLEKELGMSPKPAAPSGGSAAPPTRPQVSETIADLVAADARFSILRQALATSGLTDTLANRGPLTVFAPTDDAFAKLPAGALQSLLLPANRTKLINLLLFHIVPGEYDQAKLAGEAGSRNAKTALRGTTVPVNVSAGAARIGDANVVQADIYAKNGVIHAIDTVLMPPTP